MKQLLITIAAVVLVGCGESQQSTPAPETKPVDPVADVPAQPPSPVKSQPYEPVTRAKATDISIHDAAKAGAIKDVKQHLADGADVNVKNANGATPLHFAATKEIAELLIAKGADVNVKDNSGYTPLDQANRYKQTETADLLRKHGGKTAEELKAEGK